MSSVDQTAFQKSGVVSIGVVLGSASRSLLYNKGPWIIEEIHAPLAADLDQTFNEMVLSRLRISFSGKGYKVIHLKTVRKEWDLYSNLSDSPQSYENLLSEYGISPRVQNIDAVLFVEYLLQPKGMMLSTERVNQLSPSSFEVTYAKSKIWLYDLDSGKRLYFALHQKGYDQVLSHVTPAAALNAIFDLSDIPLRTAMPWELEK